MYMPSATKKYVWWLIFYYLFMAFGYFKVDSLLKIAISYISYISYSSLCEKFFLPSFMQYACYNRIDIKLIKI